LLCCTYFIGWADELLLMLGVHILYYNEMGMFGVAWKMVEGRKPKAASAGFVCGSKRFVLRLAPSLLFFLDYASMK